MIYKDKTTLEQIFFWVLIIIVVFLISFPFLFGKHISNNDSVFSGLYSLYPQEMFYYISLGPTQVPDGGFFFEDKFDRVGKGYYFINIIGVIIFVLSKIFSCSIDKAFLAYKIIVSILILLLSRKIFAKYVKNKRNATFGLFVLFFSGGIGYYSKSILGWDLTAPELNFFISATTEYYLPLTLLLYIYVFHKILELSSSITAFSLKDIFLLGLALLALGIIYIYSLVVLCVFVFGIIVYTAFVKKDIARLNNLFVFLFPLPVIIYYIWLYLSILSKESRSEGLILGPNISEYVVSFFWFIIALGILAFLKRGKIYSNKVLQTLIIYIVFQFLISRISPNYFPMQIQSYVGLSFVYTLAIIILIDELSFNFKTLAIVSILFVFSIFSNIEFLKRLYNKIDSKTYPIFISKEELESYKWINNNISKNEKIAICQEKSRVLAYYTGNFVTYDVLPNNIKGKNQEFWENIKKKNYENDQLSMLIKQSELNYFYFFQSDSTCKVSEKTINYFSNKTTNLYEHDSIYIFKTDK